MATTWIKALHKSGGIAAALGRSVDYIEDSEKTDSGNLIDGYECNPFTAASEFLLSKRQYERITGRNQGKNDVIAYHIRMSFPPGEVAAEKALELGRELAMRWTRGKHQFVVAAHTNTNNPHCHIIFNSVNLEHNGKHRDFRRSAIALRKLSDSICLERGLSIIEEPKMSKGYNRAEYLGGAKAPTVRDQLRDLIDANLPDSIDFNGFLSKMQEDGCEVKQGKHLAFKLPDGKKFVRCNSLGDDYSADAILGRISGKRQREAATDFRHGRGQEHLTPAASGVTLPAAVRRPNLLIDVQAKLQEGKGAAYEQWATVFNIKQLSRTLMFLKENKIDSYDDLVRKSNSVSGEYDERLSKIKEAETRLKEISELQRQIGIYGKTRDTYRQYLSLPAKKRDDFFERNRADISLHKAAKKHFDSLRLKKLPTISSLKQEYAALAAEKKKLYAGYYELQDNHRALLTAKCNAQRVLNIDGFSPERDAPSRQIRDISYAR